MQFLKQMKKREFIEMGLKTAIGILLGIIVIFFMEAMIYSIHMKSIPNNKTFGGAPNKAVYYVVEDDANKFDIYVHHTDTDQWGLKSKDITKAKLDAALIPNGQFYGLGSARYKIVVSNGDIIEESNNTSPLNQVIQEYESNNEGITFDVFTRSNIQGEYPSSANATGLTYEQLLREFKEGGEYGNNKVYFRQQNCFELSISGTHYVVMVLFLVAIAGVYAWRFTLIHKEYKKLEKKFNKTGKIF